MAHRSEEIRSETSDQTVNGDDLSANPISSGWFQGGTALCVDGR